eukprot:GGOE01003811.1.p1 GENE.GGOE01003811.1~~GGOE01003811.1.p1  ORF type:complete len:449 (+),score=53.61 GGOE01003811.1:106-1347(+)
MAAVASLSGSESTYSSLPSDSDDEDEESDAVNGADSSSASSDASSHSEEKKASGSDHSDSDASSTSSGSSSRSSKSGSRVRRPSDGSTGSRSHCSTDDDGGLRPAKDRQGTLPPGRPPPAPLLPSSPANMYRAADSPLYPAAFRRAERQRVCRFLPNRDPLDILKALYCEPQPRHYRPPPQPRRLATKAARRLPSPAWQSPINRRGSAQAGTGPLPSAPQVEAGDGAAGDKVLTDEVAPPPPPPPHQSVFDVADIHVGRWRRPRSAPLPSSEAAFSDDARVSANATSPVRCTCRPATAGAVRPKISPGPERPADYVGKYAALLHEGWTPVRKTDVKEWDQEIRCVARGRNQGFLGARPKPQRLDAVKGRELGDRLSRKWLAERRRLREEERRLKLFGPQRPSGDADEEDEAEG